MDLDAVTLGEPGSPGETPRQALRRSVMETNEIQHCVNLYQAVIDDLAWRKLCWERPELTRIHSRFESIRDRVRVLAAGSEAYDVQAYQAILDREAALYQVELDYQQIMEDAEGVTPLPVQSALEFLGRVPNPFPASFVPSMHPDEYDELTATYKHVIDKILQP